MSKNYNPKNWYWIVGGSTSQVYSSASGDYVPVANATYQAWRADGTMPTAIDTEANLGGVLAQYYPDVTRPVPTAILEGYQQAQADDIFGRKLIKFLFVLNNRVRALEGQPAMTVAQARAYFKRLM